MGREFKELFAELGVDLDYSHETDGCLATELARIKGAQAALSGAAKNVQAEIDSRWSERVAAKYTQMKKEGGAVSISMPGGLKVKASSSKKVAWDQGKLKLIASRLNKEEFDHYFSMSLRVPEKVYNDSVQDMKDAFDSARTVEWGKPNITLEVKE